MFKSRKKALKNFHTTLALFFPFLPVTLDFTKKKNGEESFVCAIIKNHKQHAID